jgi:transcriptional regulator NrdR family protein
MYGKPPLRMKCPHCKKEGEHRVISTDPNTYRWNDQATPIFESLVGEDISYRKRLKECYFCSTQFNTVEMAEHFLAALIDEVIRAQQWRYKALDEIRELKAQHEKLQLTIQSAVSTLARSIGNGS